MNQTWRLFSPVPAACRPPEKRRWETSSRCSFSCSSVPLRASREPSGEGRAQTREGCSSSLCGGVASPPIAASLLHHLHGDGRDDVWVPGDSVPDSIKVTPQWPCRVFSISPGPVSQQPAAVFILKQMTEQIEQINTNIL